MKAVDIIDQLSQGAGYTNQNGVISVDKDTKMKEYLPQFFGENIETIYDPHDFFNLWIEGERNFFYMYNERFATSLDSQIFAILYADESDIIYIYEIE